MIKRSKRSQSARFREYQKKWDALIDRLVKYEKEGRPTKRIRAQIMKLNREYGKG
jgi:hypothetical protein